VTIDIGDARRIHPPNKQEVGRRLSLLARAIAYGESVVASGPVYQSMRVDGDKARLRFSHVDGGLVARDGASLTGFAISGPVGVWHSARAEIVGDEVVVSDEQVAKPKAVRYGWANHPECNLFNREGLPAAPFRTDP
ncbi:MAG: 9-O-acetylesterase, partial [Verrucomicrobiae bacterium]|nr:9-O-acetylesterase [Verrucomicrobiae bacterium]